jgi:hypothetical protein
MRTKRAKHQLRNSNAIVRVRNKRIHRCLKEVSYQLGCPYQTVFEELCEMFVDGYTFGYNTGDVLTKRLLERYCE